MKKGVRVLAMVLALLGCTKEDDPPVQPAAGVGLGGVGGAAGIAGGAGMAGAAAGAGGVGMAGAGGGGAAGGVPGCSAADTSAAPSALHAAAVEALAAMPPTSSCGGSTSCHQGAGKAELSLLGVTDLRMALVGNTSCEAPAVPLVDGSMGDAALNNSWLWIKLTVPTDASGNVVSNPAWGAIGNCGQTPNTYGLRMPYGLSGDNFLSDANLAKIRNWICAGAPGP